MQVVQAPVVIYFQVYIFDILNTAEIEEINFQIFKIEYEIKFTQKAFEKMGIDPESKVNALLEKLSKLIKKEIN